MLSLSPDAGNGETEWALTAGLLLVAAILFITARLEWRRLATACWRIAAGTRVSHLGQINPKQG
jgi:hypothetical protein